MPEQPGLAYLHCPVMLLVTQYDVTSLITFMPQNYGMLCIPKIAFPPHCIIMGYTMTTLCC